MKERCIDANIIVKLATEEEPYQVEARRFIEDSLADGFTLIAPAYYISEVDSAICKRVFRKDLTIEEAKRIYKVALDPTPIHIITHPELRERARNIALDFHQRFVYDATYAALAELRNCEFWTADEKFYKEVKDKLPYVKFLPNYQ